MLVPVPVVRPFDIHRDSGDDDTVYPLNLPITLGSLCRHLDMLDSLVRAIFFEILRRKGFASISDCPDRYVVLRDKVVQCLQRRFSRRVSDRVELNKLAEAVHNHEYFLILATASDERFKMIHMYHLERATRRRDRMHFTCVPS